MQWCFLRMFVLGPIILGSYVPPHVSFRDRAWRDGAHNFVKLRVDPENWEITPFHPLVSLENLRKTLKVFRKNDLGLARGSSAQWKCSSAQRKCTSYEPWKRRASESVSEHEVRQGLKPERTPCFLKTAVELLLDVSLGEITSVDVVLGLPAMALSHVFHLWKTERFVNQRS